MAHCERELAPVYYSAAAVKVLRYRQEAGRECVRLHWHDRMEILRIHTGELHAEIGTQPVTAGPDRLLIVPPKMPHTAMAGEEAVRYDVLMFDVRSFYNETEVCRRYLPAVFEGRARFVGVTDDADTVSCVDDIVAAGEPSLAVTAGVYQLLYWLCERCLLGMVDDTGERVVREMIDYMEERFDRELSTASLAAQFGYTEAHFCRKFKAATGLTPMQYLKIYRLEEANRRLKEDGSIGEVAAACGFSDANYFTRCFRLHFGAPPTKYRR